MEPTPTHVCIINAHDSFGLLLTQGENQSWNIHGFKSEAEGLHYFESSYNRAHGRSYEGSMSACINAISFRPSILPLTLDEIRPLLQEQRRTTIRNVSGSVNVILMIHDLAKPLWEKGTKPQLISI